MDNVAGYSDWAVGKRNAWKRRIIEVTLEGDGQMPPAKKFKAKHDLPELTDYRKPAPDSFWEIFPSNKAEVGRSMICGKKVEVYGGSYWLLDTSRRGCV
jgi:hypothetical protein